MVATSEESIASLRLLVAVAKADGVLREEERIALEAALRDYEPDGEHGVDPKLALGLLLGEDPDLDAILGAIRTEDARTQVYGAAYAVANADGACSPEEAAVLDRVRRTFAIGQEQQAYLERVFQPRTVVVRDKPGAVPMFEGIERRQKIEGETRKTAIVSALLGAFPLPLLSIATELAVTGLQVALAKDIASYYGEEIDAEKATGLLAGFGVGTGARIAVTSLLKVFPGWGSAAGAMAAYASTYAVGKVLTDYFEEGGGDPANLKDKFASARKEGKAVYQSDKSKIDAKAEASKDKLAALGKKLEAGEITAVEFEAQATALE
jgi:uncharacterized protein (DUF697 family)/uncharacterized tellurite resistance protein B-like protein